MMIYFEILYNDPRNNEPMRTWAGFAKLQIDSPRKQAAEYGRTLAGKGTFLITEISKEEYMEKSNVQ